jgi:methionyl-tRNA formyltransferase
MHVVRELDAGDVISIKTLMINAEETGGTLHDRLALLAPGILAEAIVNLTKGTAVRVPQDAALSSYIPKLEREDGRLDWTQDAATIERRIRAYDPWPGTFTVVPDDGQEKRLKIFPPTEVVDQTLTIGEFAQSADGKLLLGCGSQALQIHWVQPEGGRRMKTEDYLRGRKRGK